MRGPRRAMPGVLALAAALSIGCSAGPASERSNVLLVTIDTLRADHVDAYGAAWGATPTLDTLAERGVRFQTAIAASPLTLPSHASILTGLDPPRHGVRHNGLYRLADATETLAERLQEEGYATAAVVGSVVLARRFGLDAGFERYDDAVSPRAAVPGGFLERDAEAVTERALAWLAEVREPFFLWVHYYDPHFEYRAPSRFAERFPEHPYVAEIAFVDASLGRLVEGLAAERASRTAVVVTADHGESLGEHGEVTHGYGLYDATLRVPLLVTGPGVPAGRVIETLARSVDVAPTVLQLAGLPVLEGDGESLVPHWSERAEAPRRAYAETLATRIDHGWSPLFAIRSPTHLYVRAPRRELYDVREDPRQLHNLFERDESAAESVAAALESELERIRTSGKRDAPEALDAETRRQLVALGYAIPEQPLPDSGIDPKDGLHWLAPFYEAQHAFAQGDLERSRALASAVVSALPTSAEAHALLARVLALQGAHATALEHARSATRLVPGSARFRALLGNARLNAGQPDAAAADYRAALALDDRHPLAHAGLIWLEASQGNLERALDHERVALAQDPSNAELRAWIAALWERAGRFEQARAAYAGALELAPDSAPLHMAMAIQLARIGRLPESERHRERAGALADAPHLRNRLAIAYIEAGQPERAEVLLRDLVSSHPAYPTARRNLALLLRQTGRAGEAERMERGLP